MEIELYEGAIFVIPKPPPKEKILNYGLPKKDQRWVRTELPADWDTMSETDQEEFAFEEDRKCTEGIHFYNNGVLTYITGDHYYYLNWFTVDIGYPQYRDRDRRWFYHWWICDNDIQCIGQCYSKHRRDGYSYRVSAIILNRARKTFKSNYGIISKTGLDAQEMFSKVTFAFKHSPEFFKPQVRTAEDTLKELIFQTPQQKVTYKNRRVKKEIALETRIDYRNTKQNAYDGSKQKILAVDECFGKGTKILCEGFVFKNIEDIIIGENVIVEGGKLVEVVKIFNGEDEMFLIEQPYGKDYICSSKHKLYLEKRERTHGVLDKITKITPQEYFNLGPYQKRTTYRITSSGIEFKERHHIIDPYLFGVWLGDGTSDCLKIIINMEEDIEIYNYIIKFCERNDIKYTILNCDSKKCKYVYLKSDNINFLDELRRLGAMKNKNIPKEYLLDSYSNRLKLLAGIIDTDGHLTKSGYIEVTMSRENLIKDIYTLAASLGFSVSNIRKKKTNFNTFCYRISITGDLNKLPMLVHRKDNVFYRKEYKSRRCKMDIKPIGKGQYFGIQLKAINDDDRRLILEDFTLSMNCGKWEEVNFQKWYNIGKTCVTLGGKIIGKLLVGSTVNEATKGGSAYKEIWDRSSMLKKNDNGRTGSWLYRYFVPAYDGLEGFIDEYGTSVIETPKESVMGIDGFLITMGSKEYLLNERRSLEESGDTVGYFEELRQRPFTEEEMFRDPANENTQFDLDKIYAQITFNESIPNQVLVRGNFAWENGKKDTKVIWEVTPQGRWLVYWMPLPEDRNKIILKRGQKAPGNPHEGLFSVDPYDHKYTTSKKKSKAASHGMHKTSFSNPALSGVPISQYWYRPNDPSILYEDMLMQCIFYGWPILGESNKPGCINHFRNRGYEHFLMDRPAFTHTEYSEKNQKEKWLPNTGDADKGIRRMLIEHAASKVYRSVGVNDETQRMGNFMFNDTLTDLSKFDPDNWTDYDLTVSYMLGVIGLDDYVPQKKERPKNPKFFQTYSHEGIMSEPVNAFPKDFKGGGPIIVNPDSETAKKTSEARRRWGL